MARLADYWPSSDDESHQSTQSRQRGSDVQVECTYSVTRMYTPTKRDLVPKSTQTASSRKMRRLCGRGQAADNPLFQPWSAEDHDGTQARSQTTMRESPAKLGLVTEFEKDSPPATARSAGIKTLRLISPTRKVEGCPEVFRKGTLFPPPTEEREITTSKFGSAHIPEGHVSPDKKMHWTLSSSSDQEPFNHGLHQETSTESSVNSFNINNTVDDDASYDSFDEYRKMGSFSSLGPGLALASLPPGVGKFIYNPLDYEQSSVSKDYVNAKQTGPDRTLKPIRENLSSPSRVLSIKLDNELALQGKSAMRSTRLSDDENLLSSFEKMRIDPHGMSTGDSPEPPNNLSDFTTPPSSPKGVNSPRKHEAIPRTPRGPTADASLAETFADDWNCELSHSKQIKLVRPVSQSKVATRKGKKAEFEATKQSIAERFLLELDLQITNGRISKLTDSTDGVKIIWTKSLHTTAGRANWRRETVRTKQSDGSVVEISHKHHASIELADKVIDDENRLLNVLAHEFCHLTTFMISGITTNPHGKEFKSWASKCSRIFGQRGIQVTTKHSYEIDFTYKWECADCGLGYKRHSKSIDTQRHRCGTCKGELKQVKPAPRVYVTNNSGASGRGEYQLFVKDQMKLVKLENPDIPQREILRMIAGKWADEKKKKKKKNQKTDSRTTEDAVTGKQLDEADVTTRLVVDLTFGD